MSSEMPTPATTRRPLNLLWMTDLHLEFIKDSQVRKFFTKVASHEPDVVLVGGDTGQARSFERYLTAMASAMECPIYFVLGNHDFYKGSISDVRARAAAICATAQLFWLPQAGVVGLTERVPVSSDMTVGQTAGLATTLPRR